MTVKVSQRLLNVYLHDKWIGILYCNNAKLSFKYNPEYISDPNAKKLSVSLPLEDTLFNHERSEAFFSGLLPDESVRDALAKCLHVSEKNTFGLLELVGGECAGAVSLYPEGSSPNNNLDSTYKILSNFEADNILTQLHKNPLLANDRDIRISGAGAQYKLMISFIDDKIAIPTNNTPSTHIIKPVIKDIESSVQNEFFCMSLAKRLKFNVPDVKIIWIDSKPYYVIKRYDRIKNNDGKIMRLHQEDFCQALHIAPEYKYENEGGPSLKDCFNLLSNRISNGYMAGNNKISLLQVVIYNFLIGNGDAHGKNFSILYKQDYEELAPSYDLMSTVIYSDLHTAKMAMKLSGKYKFKEVFLRHFEKLEEITGFRSNFIIKQVTSINEGILSEAEELLEHINKSHNNKDKIYKNIIEVIKINSRKLTQ